MLTIPAMFPISSFPQVAGRFSVIILVVYGVLEEKKTDIEPKNVRLLKYKYVQVLMSK